MTESQARAQARRLVVAGASYEEAAAETGVPVSTLQKVGAREGWTKQRSTAADYLANAAAMKRLMMERCMAALAEATDTASLTAANQLHQQLLAMEKAFPEYRYGEQRADPKVRLGVAMEALELLVGEYLATRDRNAITALAPHITGFAAWYGERLGA